MALDDSFSMQENQIGLQSLFSLSILAQAINQSQIGDLVLAKMDKTFNLLFDQKELTDTLREEICLKFNFDF